jgi:hypothetical protein
MQVDRLDSFLQDRQPESEVSVLELRRLLVLLAENAHSVCFRYRLIGAMWEPRFLRVIHVTDRGAFLKDTTKNRTISLPDLKMIMQFELDGSIHAFQPNYHYDVVPNPHGK